LYRVFSDGDPVSLVSIFNGATHIYFYQILIACNKLKIMSEVAQHN
jgi:hypothetical protein